jgi:hypothetical protein
MRTIRSRLARHAITVGVALVAGFVSALPPAAERLAAEPRTNQGAKYTLDYGTKLHTPGSKSVYRGSSSKLHTNPGGKYVYRGYPAAPR